MAEESKDIKLFFSEALARENPAERKAYLDKVCQDDQKLRAEIEELLEAHGEAGDFLEAGASETGATLNNTPSIEGPGSRISHYELLELIGEGGMGLVYLAEQKEPVKRRVALKIIKPGMDSRQVIARFEAERQVLALLDHPNIAHVLDAGTTGTGKPYFVMEYVKGLSITRYCDDNKLNIEQRLKLFRQACEGIHHAHQKGIIHRDLKPSNILVSVHGDRVVPKIIDFGIAKATTQPLTDKTVFTFQGQLLGTPEYMSPEQVDLAMQDIDIRSDIYSLGVVLYELLAGVLPFEGESLARLGFAEVQRTIREQEPTSPSIRLSSLGEQAKAIAESRRTQVVPLARRLHKELEWIPLKAMRKDRCRRYRSAAELADDVQNYLDGNPLIAGPETAVYRVKKFVRRHAGSVATVVLIAVTILLGLVISTAMYFRAEKMRVQAHQASQKEAAARTQAQQSEKIAQEQRKLAEEKTEDYRRALYVSHISLANAEYQGGNIGRVRELLKSCPNDLRRWEWNYLQSISDQAIKTFRGQQIGKWFIAISPAGDRIASGGQDKTVVVWNAITGAEIMTLRGHKDSLNAVDYSPDGSRILSSSNDKTIKVWDAITGTQILTMTEPGLAAASASFSPDGKRIVSGTWDGAVRIWDATTGVEIMTLGWHDEDAMSVAFSPDGKRVVSGSWDKTVKIWDAASGSELMTLHGHELPVLGVSFSPDGKRIASCSRDDTIKVWDVESGTEMMTLRGHAGAVSGLAFSPDGRYIASGSYDNLVKLWDTTTGTDVTTLRGHRDAVGSVVFSPDGKYLASASKDNTIKIWDATIDREHTTLASHQEPVTSVAFSHDGKQVVSGSCESTTQWELDHRPAMSMTLRGQVKIWDVASAAEVMTLQGDSGVSAVAFSADGKRVVTGNTDGTLTMWDATNETRLMTLAGHGRPVFSASFSPDDKRVVSGCMDGTIKIWDMSKGIEMLTLSGHRSPVWAAAFSPDGKLIVSGGLDGKVIVWNAATGAQLMNLCGYHYAVRTVTFSPDGRLIAAGGNDDTIRIWNTATGTELTTLRGHKSYVLCVAFSPDNKRIVSGSNDRTVRVWDIETGAELMAVRGYRDQVKCVTFSPDGQTIAVSNDCNIELLESAPLPQDHELRRTTKNARAIVDRLYEQQGFYHDVISELYSDNEIAEPLRKTALQIAYSRRSEDAQELERESWEVVSSLDKEPESYREALEKAEKACTLEPDSWRLVRTLGAAQYRVGAYEDAVATLRRAEKMRVNARGEPDSANTAFLAMALCQLGLTQEARTVLDGLLRGLWAEMSMPIYHRLNVHWRPLTYEAEKLFAGENTKLHVLWEAVEGVKPEHAAQLVEELRALNDTGIAARMEGAVKLLATSYYDRAKSHTFAYLEVISLYEIVVRVDPYCAIALNDLAWLRVNCPPDQARDTAKALEEAKKACELTEWKNYHYISTLAAAYSEVGDFVSAVKWQQKAIDLLPEDERTQWETNYEQRLQLYELSKPYHQGDLWSFSTGKMVGWWKFDEAEGNTVPDSSGNGIHGRLLGDARIVSDPERGSVLSLDGDGDYVDCGNSAVFDITGSITTTAWIKADTLNMFNKDKTHQVIISKGDYAYAWVLDLVQDDGMYFGGYYYYGLSEQGYEEWGEVEGIIGVNDGKWHHVTGVYDGTKSCLYVDGKLDTCDTNWGNIKASRDPLYIGEDPLFLKYGWKGLIDDVRIYSYALSPEEVKMLYEGKEPPREKRSED